MQKIKSAIAAWFPKPIPRYSECAEIIDGHANSVLALAVLPDGRLVSGSSDKTIILGSQVIECKSDWVGSLAVLPDGNLISGHYNGKTKIWNDGKCIRTRSHGIGTIYDMAVLPNGMVAICIGRHIQILNENGMCAGILIGHENYVLALVVLPKENGASFLLASASVDKTIRIWNFDVFPQSKNSHVCVKKLLGHTNTVRDLAVMSDGNLVSGSFDKTVRIWNDKKITRVLTGHKGYVHAVAGLPGNRIASGSADQTIRIWSAEGVCLTILAGHSDSVCSLVALPDDRLASGSYDGTVCVWKSKSLAAEN